MSYRYFAYIGYLGCSDGCHLSKDRTHKEVLSTVITTTVNNAVNDNDNLTGNTFIDNAFKTVSNAFAGKVIETAVDNLVTVDNYVVCSLGKVHYEGKDHIVSLGVFGHIFTVDEDDLREAAEQYYKKEEINMKEQLKKKHRRCYRKTSLHLQPQP